MGALKHFKLVACLFLGALGVNAAPIFVSYTVSGTSGDYTLDFTVTNNMTSLPSQDVYFFGVQLSVENVTGSPTNYTPNTEAPWSNTGYGGSSIVYNNVWIDDFYTDLLPGNSLSGFDVTIPDSVVPTSVLWFAFSYSPSGADLYTVGDNFYTQQNPGFESTAYLNSSVPEPASWITMLAGMTAIAFRLRRR